MIEDPLEYLENHIRGNYFQYDIEEKFYSSYKDYLSQGYQYSNPGTRFKIDYDEVKEVYRVLGKQIGKQEINEIHTKDSFVLGEANALESRMIKAIKTFILQTDRLLWKSSALNFQYRILNIQNKLKKDKNKYLVHYLKCLSALNLFLLKEYIDVTPKAGVDNPSYKVHFKNRFAIKRFYNQLISYKFISNEKVPFNQFLAGKYPDQKIQWLATATAFKAFIDQMCEGKHIDFFGPQTKWNTLKEIFILPNSKVPWGKVCTQKPPKAKIKHQLENCFYELDEFKLLNTRR